MVEQRAHFRLGTLARGRLMAVATCPNCSHLYAGGPRCPVCNYSNEATHERIRSAAERQDNLDQDQYPEGVAMDQEGVARERRGELRKIENGELRPNQVGNDLYMKWSKCESKATPGCYLNDHWTIHPFCKSFAWHHDGFKCAWPHSV